MAPQAVSNTLSSLKAALLQRLEQLLPQANAFDVANSLWAAAKLGLRLSNGLKAALAQALQRIIPAANSQELANSLLACGTLGWSPGRRVLAAAVAAMQQRLASGGGVSQAIRNFLWGLAELQGQLEISLPAELPALLAAAAEWADSRWAQLSALDSADLCYNLARLGHRPGSAWIGSATESELEQLVLAAVDSMAADWEKGGRGGGLRFGDALTRQDFRVGSNQPAATAALEGRLLPLVCADIDLIAIDQLHPEKGTLPYLAGWANSLAAIGLRLSAQQLKAVCSCVSKHPKQLRPGDRSNLEKAFRTWAFQPGLALLGQLAGA
ncbi:hypothetical protein COHA_009917 [Chlorella ohadii]|uniref:Uncharacterized protein n=1 Tax=Chlorella ohadii TaxID=2649997 RepID=A0AAD5DHC8_9CHLO|nr:hypothetical protein COHA_009917 [Chlorella ohadii]